MGKTLTLAFLIGAMAWCAHAAPLRVCMVSGSFEYDSDTALALLEEYLETRCGAEVTLLQAASWTEIPGLEALDDCDVALFYTRRLLLAGEALERVKAYLTSGRPLVAIRTASHGFQGYLEFDREVLGGNYNGHYGEGPTTEVNVPPRGRDHPILEGVGPIRSRYSLYRNKGVADDTEVLLLGRTPEMRGREPLAWTREHGGGRVFYTSLGGVGDFEGASFKRMLANALFWAARREPEWKPLPPVPPRARAEGVITLPVRLREKDPETGAWAEREEARALPAAETALIICDMWDKHWCDFASERVAAMAPRVDEVAGAARAAGVLVIHCPSETLGFYADSVPRRRALEAAPAQPVETVQADEPPLPIDDSDGGCPDDQESYGVWTRQQPAIAIHDSDALSDDGREVYNLLAQEGIRHVVFTGVHTNMCVLGRSFGIRQLTRWGLQCYLLRDLTDTMYNPAMPPRVSHDEGTELVVQHIEQYWCPSATSAGFLSGLPATPTEDPA